MPVLMSCFVWPNRLFALKQRGKRVMYLSASRNLRAKESNGKITFPFFYHMTHKDNIGGIMRHGIVSHTAVLERNDILARDISDHGVQQRRERPETEYFRSIHDYVPLYINPKNPMLYLRKNMQQEIVILRISPSILDECYYVFCDGNAASQSTKYSVDPEVLRPSLEVLNAEYWNNFADGRRRRCAEVLIYPHVRPGMIDGAICYSAGLAKEIARVAKCKVEHDQSMFF